MSQGLLLEGISFIRLLGEGRLALECTSLSTRRRKEGAIARSLPWLSRLREASERKKTDSTTVQPVQFIWPKEAHFIPLHISSLCKSLGLLRS